MINQFVRLKCWTWTVSLNSKSWVEIRIFKASFSYLHKTRSICCRQSVAPINISSAEMRSRRITEERRLFYLPFLFTHPRTHTLPNNANSSFNAIPSRCPIVLQTCFLATMHVRMFKNKLLHALICYSWGVLENHLMKVKGCLSKIIAMCCVSYTKMNKITATIVCMQTAASHYNLWCYLEIRGFSKHCRV